MKLWALVVSALFIRAPVFHAAHFHIITVFNYGPRLFYVFLNFTFIRKTTKIGVGPSTKPSIILKIDIKRYKLIQRHLLFLSFLFFFKV